MSEINGILDDSDFEEIDLDNFDEEGTSDGNQELENLDADGNPVDQEPGANGSQGQPGTSKEVADVVDINRYKSAQRKITEQAEEIKRLKTLDSRLKAIEDRNAEPPPKRLKDFSPDELAEMQLNDPVTFAELTIYEAQMRTQESQSQAVQTEAQKSQEAAEVELMIETLDGYGIKPPDDLENDIAGFEAYRSKVDKVRNAMVELGFTKLNKSTIALAFKQAFPVEAAKHDFNRMNAGPGREGVSTSTTSGDPSNNTSIIPGFDQSRANDKEYYKELARTPDGRRILDQITARKK